MSDGVNGKVNGGGEFGQLLAGFRFGRGLSQEELADRSGMSVRAIRSLEHGQVGHEGKLAGILDLAGNVERPELRHLDRGFRLVGQR